MRVFFLLILVALVSCKKTKLEGDLAILIGKWEWKHTLLIDDICDVSAADSSVLYSPSSEGHTYEVTFIEKGKLEIRKSGEKMKKYRLILRSSGTNGSDTTFSFFLNKRNKDAIRLQYHKYSGKEYLYTNDMPLGLVNGFDGCRAIQSTFEKVK